MKCSFFCSAVPLLLIASCITLIAASWKKPDINDRAVSQLKHVRGAGVRFRQLNVNCAAYTKCPRADVDSCDENTPIDTNYMACIFMNFHGSGFDTITVLEEHSNDLTFVRIKSHLFRLLVIELDTIEPASIDLTLAPCYRVTTSKHSYICFIAGGTGIYRSGSFQSVRFYLIYDEDNPNPVVLLSAINSVYSLIDYNSDGVIDFVRYFVPESEPDSRNLAAEVLIGTPDGFITADTLVAERRPLDF